MKLKKLHIYRTPVTDLTPLEGMELEDLRFTPRNITIGIAHDKAWPAAEFWQRHDAGEFTK